MSLLRLKMEERLLKEKEPEGSSKLPCGICGQEVRRRKYQSHWALCFLKQEKNTAKVKGPNS
jgi:hypothetical protein